MIMNQTKLKEASKGTAPDRLLLCLQLNWNMSNRASATSTWFKNSLLKLSFVREHKNPTETLRAPPSGCSFLHWGSVLLHQRHWGPAGGQLDLVDVQWEVQHLAVKWCHTHLWRFSVRVIRVWKCWDVCDWVSFSTNWRCFTFHPKVWRPSIQSLQTSLQSNGLVNLRYWTFFSEIFALFLAVCYF